MSSELHPDPATTATGTPAPPPLALRERPGRWLDGYRPEDPDFWESTGRPIAQAPAPAECRPSLSSQGGPYVATCHPDGSVRRP